MIVDGIITLSTLIAFGDIRLPIYSVIIIFIEGKVIDLVVDGMKTYKTMFIITDTPDPIRDYIINDIKRGGTLITGSGLYKGTERKMLYVTLDRSDMIKLRSVLYQICQHSGEQRDSGRRVPPSSPRISPRCGYSFQADCRAPCLTLPARAQTGMNNAKQMRKSFIPFVWHFSRLALPLQLV